MKLVNQLFLAIVLASTAGCVSSSSSSPRTRVLFDVRVKKEGAPEYQVIKIDRYKIELNAPADFPFPTIFEKIYEAHQRRTLRANDGFQVYDSQGIYSGVESTELRRDAEWEDAPESVYVELDFTYENSPGYFQYAGEAKLKVIDEADDSTYPVAPFGCFDNCAEIWITREVTLDIEIDLAAATEVN